MWSLAFALLFTSATAQQDYFLVECQRGGQVVWDGYVSGFEHYPPLYVLYLAGGQGHVLVEGDCVCVEEDPCG